MAALVEGRKYGLASLQSTSAGKSLIHVKLTDSALKAIEEFQKIKVRMASTHFLVSVSSLDGQHMVWQFTRQQRVRNNC